jgi:Na+/H+ antiporter NhaC
MMMMMMMTAGILEHHCLIPHHTEWYPFARLSCCGSILRCVFFLNAIFSRYFKLEVVNVNAVVLWEIPFTLLGGNQMFWNSVLPPA